MENYFAKNLVFLVNKKGKTQSQTALELNLSQSRLNNYLKGKSYPPFLELINIIKYFEVTASEMLEMDLSNVHLTKKIDNVKNEEKVHLNVHPTVHPTAKNQAVLHEYKLMIAAEPDAQYGKKHTAVPITDITVAAGAGIYNTDYVDHTDHLTLPARMVKKGFLHLVIKAKGPSMAPTLFSDSYLVIRLLDRSEWAEMPDNNVYVVCDMEGKGYIKRVKNRFKQDFIVLTSDNPDKVTFGNFNLETKDIHHIWIVVAKLDFRMPNIHDQYYTKLEQMDDRLTLLEQKLLKG